MTARSLSALFKKSVLSTTSSEVGIMLLKISCASFPQTYYICDNNQDFVSNGITYTKWAFELAFCDEEEGQIPTSTVVIDNALPTVWEAIRSANIGDEITIEMQFVTASEPNTNQLLRTVKYIVSEVEADAINIVAQIVLATITNDSLPYHKITPSLWPGIAGGKAS